MVAHRGEDFPATGVAWWGGGLAGPWICTENGYDPTGPWPKVTVRFKPRSLPVSSFVSSFIFAEPAYIIDFLILVLPIRATDFVSYSVVTKLHRFLHQPRIMAHRFVRASKYRGFFPSLLAIMTSETFPACRVSTQGSGEEIAC
jgi:hypothetical protein